MKSYKMVHVDLTVPAVKNDGTASYYPERIGDMLRAESGITGWTETAGTGIWRGEAEPVVVFTFYRNLGEIPGLIYELGRVGQKVMPDQEAIQIVEHAPVILYEA